MGTYATCWVGNLHIVDSKSGVDPHVMGLFRATDRRVRKSSDPSLPDRIAVHIKEEESEAFTVTYYEAPISVVRDRLELEGYTLANARHLFEEWRTLELKQQQSWDARSTDPLTKAFRTNDLRKLRELTADRWIGYLRRINDEDLTFKNKKDDFKDSFLGDMLLSYNDDAWYGYSGPDPFVAIRLAIEACPEAESFTYDLTDLVLGEYLHPDEDPIEQVIDSTAGDYHSLGRIVVLTEGRSDAWILKEAMSLLYPHLVGYYSFMDFEEFRVGGGAGQLANLVRAFGGAGIVNRVIAIFDNDSAAAAALKALRKTKVPAHIVSMQLPALDLLRTYPTLGPSGPSAMDINGLAGSIELYLGTDVLRNSDDGFSPIQWTGYEQSVQAYQGELLSRAEVQDRFRSKLARAKEDLDYLRSTDWSGLKAIFQSVFEAFHDLDLELLTQQLRLFYKRY